MGQETRERARRARATAQMAHAQVLKVAESVAAAEDHFAATMERLAESQPHYREHLDALRSQARKQAAAERRWAKSHELIVRRGGSLPATAGGEAHASMGDTAGGGALAPAVMVSLVRAFPEAVALADADGLIRLANERLGEIFGYERDELIGRSVETLVPAALRAAHNDHRTAYAQAPKIRLKDDRAPLAGLRKDGSTVMVEISLSPALSEAGQYTLAVVREQAREQWTPGHFPEHARAADTEEHRRQELILLGQVVNNIYKVGRNLRGALATQRETLGERTAQAVQVLDDTVRQVREHVLSTHPGEIGPNPMTGDRVD